MFYRLPTSTPPVIFAGRIMAPPRSLKHPARLNSTMSSSQCEPFREWGGIATASPLDLKGNVDRAAVDAIEAFVSPHVGTGRFLITLTGEHTGALGAIRAHAKRYPTDDGCADRCSWRSYGRPIKAIRYSHASVMARVVDDGLHLVQVGIRSISPEEIARIEATDRITTFFAANILDPSGPYEGKASNWIPDVVAACRTPVYLTFDCDGLDASIVPALGTPEPGGLGWYDTLHLITALANGPGIRRHGCQ